MLDCLIKDGLVVDGSGVVGRRADIGIRAGKVVAVGEVEESAARTVDASGMVVCPGFVDVHTHYDAQIMWDPWATPSCLHGVTTLIGGNCGFGIAPLADDAAEYIGAMLAVVEGIPSASLQAGLDWDWGSFGDWLCRLDGRLGVNAAFLVGHSVLRRVVMGAAAVGTAATGEQVERMTRLLHASLAAGGLGFSSSWAPTHFDGDSQPVPSRAAAVEELVALAAATGEHPGTALAFIPGIPPFAEAETDAMIAMSRAANRPLNWNTFRVLADDLEQAEAQLAPNTTASERGARILALAFPSLAEFVFTFEKSAPLIGLPDWSDTMQLPVPERMRVFRSPEARERLALGASAAKGTMANLTRWGDLVVLQTAARGNEELAGRSIGDIANASSRSPFDAILDITLSEDLRTVFAASAVDDAGIWELRARYWGDPRTLIGGSDAGAHVDTLCASRYTTDFVGPSVRDRGLVPLERAVELLTDIPARLFGLVGRGRIAEGYWADLVVFDPASVGPGPVHARTDLPGRATRLYSDPIGIEFVFVNGTPIVEHNEITDELPGIVLRSGRDTETVTAR